MVIIIKSLFDIFQYAHNHKLYVNPQLFQLNTLLKTENKDFTQFGYYYCPCKMDKVPENSCPCTEHINEIQKDQHCHCMMYYNRSKIELRITQISLDNECKLDLYNYNGSDNMVFYYISQEKDIISKHLVIIVKHNILHFIHNCNGYFYNDTEIKNVDIVILPQNEKDKYTMVCRQVIQLFKDLDFEKVKSKIISIVPNIFDSFL